MNLKPTKTIVPVETALREWRNPDYFYQEKLDGEFATKLVGNVLLAGERMKDGTFHAFDVLRRGDEDMRPLPLLERWYVLNTLKTIVPIVPHSRNGTELLERVLATGGEGVAAKLLAGPYGPMLAAKRSQNYLCRVATFVEGKQSVVLVDAHTGAPRGACPLLGGRCDRVRVGSLLKIEAFGEHASGLLREPRPDKDTPTSWLVTF